MQRAVLDSEESKNIAVVHKTNQGYSGKDLYKLKQERPDLFHTAGAADASAASGGKKLHGFVELPGNPDWLLNVERALYYHRETSKFYCKDPSTGEQYEYHDGDDMSGNVSARCDASACAGQGAGKGAASSKHVLISDLHRAASAMKLSLTHHDSPASMYAIFDSNASGGAVAEAAAKGLHMKLLPKLASYRGLWQYDRMQAALAQCIEQLSVEIGAEEGISVAVAVLIGHQLTLAATRGASCTLFGRGDGGSGGDLQVVGAGSTPTTQCIVLDDDHLGAILTVDAVRAAGLSSGRVRSLVMQQIMAGHPKAACIKLLDGAREAGATLPLVSAAMRLTVRDADAEPAPKKSKSEKMKVRCRHILLRHTGSRTAGERRAKPTRTLAQAEKQMVALLEEIGRGGASAFTAKCKAISECDTGLRGGDLAGDLGWLDPDPAKNKSVAAPVVRAAFALTVGQLSDLVSSERGVHVLIRTA